MATKAKQAEYNRRWREKNRARLRAYKKQWVKDNRERLKGKYAATERAWRTANKERLRIARLKRQLKKLYGISYEDYQEMLLAQNGCCALCLRPESSFTKGLGVDHDHASGAVRKLLCTPCNTALGALQDDPQLLRTAAVYIESYQ